MHIEFAPVPAEKVAEVVNAYIGRATVAQVATRAGMGEKQLREVLNGNGGDYVRWDTVDRLLCAIGRPDAWYVELEDAA